MSKKLNGKVAVVTGASKGIGAAIAKQLAAEGAAVVVNYSSSREEAERVVEEITNKDGRAVAVQANVSKKADIDRLFSEAQKKFGRLDILVNNAGVYEFASLEEITEEHFHKQYNLNVLGLLLASQAAVKQFGPDGGSIINISSVASTSAPPQTSVYSGTKAAVDAVTRSLAQELGQRKIRVNSINPGMVATEGLRRPALRIATSENKSRPRRRWAASASLRILRQPPRFWLRTMRRGSRVKLFTSQEDFAELATSSQRIWRKAIRCFESPSMTTRSR